jgi:hypothetical protein
VSKIGYFVKSVDQYNINNAFVSGMYVTIIVILSCVSWLTVLQFQAGGFETVPKSAELYANSLVLGLYVRTDPKQYYTQSDAATILDTEP